MESVDFPSKLPCSSVYAMNDCSLNLIFIAESLTCCTPAGTDLFVRYAIVNVLCATYKSCGSRYPRKVVDEVRAKEVCFSRFKDTPVSMRVPSVSGLCASFQL